VTAVEPHAWGALLRTPDLPLIYHLNLLRVEGDAAGLDAAGLAAEADALQAGLGHRKLDVLDDATALRLAPGLAERGYVRLRLPVLVLDGEPDRPWPDGGVELGDEEYYALRRVDRAREPWTDDPDELRQSLEADARQAAAGSARRFGARVHGTAVSWCTVLHDGAGTWEIDDVGTLEEHRGRGRSRAALGAAIAAVRADGAEVVYITADEDDWVIGFYERLGFRRVGRVSEFTRRPGPVLTR
jgi:ribosomal protein S18 acetylase RimI-like enzyme